MKTLVTDGNNRAALAITRSLGRAGIDVIVGDSEQKSLAGVSKYCCHRFQYPNPANQPQAFIEKILDTLQDHTPDVIMPVTEVTTLLVTRHHQEIERFTRLPFPLYDSVKKAASKKEVLQLASFLNVPTPVTRYIDRPSEPTKLIDLVADIPFPIVIKPSCSRYLTRNGIKSSGVDYAYNRKELLKKIAGIEKEAYPVLLQERIHGPGTGVFACMDWGRMIAVFSHRRIREKPPSGGVSVLRESYPVMDQLRQQSEALLKALHWHGVAMVEFKLDNRDNTFKLMEINGRYWGSLQLAIDSGVNFPLLLYHTAVGNPPEPLFDYHIGTRTRWLLGDLDSLLARLFKSTSSLNLPSCYPSKIACLKDFFRRPKPDDHFEILDKNDMNPWFLELYRWALNRT